MQGTVYPGSPTHADTGMFQTFSREDEIAVCNREQAAIAAQSPSPRAWLATLGHEDWEAEKRILMGGRP